MKARGFGLVVVSRRALPWTLLGVFASAICGAAWGDELSISGQVIYSGPSVEIGTLSASLSDPNSEEATFTLDPQFRNLMSDAKGDEFRFFQVITYDDEPTRWQGSIITPAGTANHTGDVVDVPSGGWDYESMTGNRGGDDTSPFYESDTFFNPDTFAPYRFPDLSYPDLHSADGVNPGVMNTNDIPGVSTPNDKTLFETFITYETPTMLSTNTVDVLGGYSWGVTKSDTGVVSGIAPSYIAYSDITPAMVLELQGALNRSGYANWDIISDDAILNTLAPEPAGVTIAAIAGAVCGGWGFLRRRFGGRRDRAWKL